MRLGRAVRLSLRALAAHRLRTALALVSVAVGVAGVLLTSAVGEGAGARFREDLGAGRNLIVVRPAQVKRVVSRRRVKGVVTTLRLEDADAIASLPLADAISPGADGSARLRAGSGSLPAGILGTAPSYAAIRGLHLQRGRFLDADDDATAARVAVLGARVARTLFPGEDPVGRELRLRGLPFEVIGVLEPDGVKADGSDQDGTVFVPIRTALRRVFNSTWLSAVFVSVADGASVPAAAEALRSLLRERHRIADGAADDFAVQDQVRLLAMQQQAIGSLTLLSAGLAAVSLLVGGAGILALMLLSVKERTAEIGLRMAVGARPRDVLAQFLAEATALAVGGWLLGALAAVAGAAAIATATAWKLALPTGAALASLLMALATGLGFGSLPARKAAQLPPVDALRTAC